MRARASLADIRWISRRGGGTSWLSRSFSGFSSKTNCSELSVEISSADSEGGLSSCGGGRIRAIGCTVLLMISWKSIIWHWQNAQPELLRIETRQDVRMNRVGAY